MIEGIVPEIEEREAAVFNGYTWKEWLSFDLLDYEGRWHRASCIAFYRIHHLVKSHVDDAINQEVTNRQRRTSQNG